MQEESASIKREQELKSSMDFKVLRQEAIANSQKISGDVWTDYNLHDPGVTIIEQFCYALTDLSYRTNLDIETILFHQGNQSKVRRSNALFPPEQIFPPGPLTIKDYRILLLDEFPNVISNCWINPITSHQEGILGLYEVILILKHAYSETQQKKIEQRVLSFLNSNRNLCEDFESVKFLEPEKITFNVEIEIYDDEDAGELLSRVLHEVEQYFNPTMQFHTLEELESKGIPMEEIFDVPSHKHGFLTREQLQPKKQEYYVSKIADYILGVKGVRYIKELKVFQGTIPVYGDIINVSEDQYLTLGLNHSGENESALEGFEITMSKGGITNSYNPESVAYMLDVVANQSVRQYNFSKKKQKTDHKTPRTKELAGYDSIQKTFPGIYGLGDFTPAKEEGTLRRAQSEQLKGYLLLFDQLMANHLAQLTHVVELFSIDSESQKLKTYYSQILKEQFTEGGLLARELLPQSEIQKQISELEKIKYPTDKELLILKNLREDINEQEKYLNQLIDQLISEVIKTNSLGPIRKYNLGDPVINALNNCLKLKEVIESSKSRINNKSKQSENKRRKRTIDKILEQKDQALQHLQTLIERSKAAKVTKNVSKKLSEDILAILDLFKAFNKNFKLLSLEEKNTLKEIIQELNSQINLLDDIIKDGLITDEEQDAEEMEFLISTLRVLKNDINDPLKKIQVEFDSIVQKESLLSKEEIATAQEEIDQLNAELDESLLKIKEILFEQLIQIPHQVNMNDRDLDLLVQDFDHAGERKSRLLSHMLARFGERFTTDFHIKFSSHLDDQNQENIEKQLILLKSKFLQQIVEFNRDRAKGTNYLDFKHSNPIPLHTKISLLLNFEHRGNHRILRESGDKNLKEQKINRSQIKKAEVDSLGEVRYRENSHENKAKFIVNGSNYLTYLFKYGLSKKNYKVIEDENGSAGIYFVPPTEDQPTKIQERGSVEEAYDTIDKLIESLTRINASHEGFHLVEHIIFRSEPSTEHYFYLKNEPEQIDFVSIGTDQEDQQHAKAKDAIILASYEANYKILTNRDGKHIVYIKDATGKEIAKSNIVFETEKEAKAYQKSTVEFFTKRKETSNTKTLYELGSKNQYYFQILNNSGDVLFVSKTPYSIQNLASGARLMIKLASDRANYQTLVQNEQTYVVLTNQGKEVAISDRGFQLDEEAELFVDNALKFFTEEYNERNFSQTVRYLGVDGRNAEVYNYQVSAVYPNWTSRFSNKEFLQLFAQTLFNCTPAHININLVGLNRGDMGKFEDVYFQFMDEMAAEASEKNTNLDQLKTRILDLLTLKDQN